MKNQGVKKINKILKDAEKIGKEDNLKMQKIEAWHNYIKPLFINKFACKNFDPYLIRLLSGKRKMFVDKQRIIFNQKLHLGKKIENANIESLLF